MVGWFVGWSGCLYSTPFPLTLPCSSARLTLRSRGSAFYFLHFSSVALTSAAHCSKVENRWKTNFTIRCTMYRRRRWRCRRRPTNMPLVGFKVVQATDINFACTPTYIYAHPDIYFYAVVPVEARHCTTLDSSSRGSLSASVPIVSHQYATKSQPIRHDHCTGSLKGSETIRHALFKCSKIICVISRQGQ